MKKQKLQIGPWVDPTWSGTPVATIEEIGPDRALKLLDRNTMNRPLSERRVVRYATIMKAGRWKLNGESIVFASTGELLTGQHRLYAVIESGVTIKTLVVRGIDRSAFDTMDQGAKKTSGDIVAISGYENASTVAATARWVCLYLMRDPESHLLLNSKDVSMTQIEAVLEKYPQIVPISAQTHSSIGKRYFPSPASGMLALAAQKWGLQPVLDFMTKVKEGAGLMPGDPALAYRNRIAAQGAASKIDPRNWAFICAKMLVAHCTKKQVKLIKIDSTEPFPTLD